MTILLSLVSFASFATGSNNSAAFANPERKSAPAPQAIRTLHFPANFSAGALFELGEKSSPNQDPPTRFITQARGVVKVPAKTRLSLEASYALSEQPECLQALDPNALEQLQFSKMGTDDKLFGPLSHLVGIKVIGLDFSELTDAGLEKLKPLVNIEELSLANCGIKGTCFKKLQGMSKLARLTLSFNDLTPDAVEAISHFQSLKQLVLSKTQIDDTALYQIAKLPHLQLLKIDRDDRITAKGLAAIQRMKALETLYLDDTKLRVSDLLALKGSHLKTMALPQSHYLESDLHRLHMEFPGVELLVPARTVSREDAELFAPLH